MVHSLSRRRFLCLCGGSAASLAGCGGGGDDGTPSTPQATDVGCSLYSASLSGGLGCNQILASSFTPFDAQIGYEFLEQQRFFQLPNVSLFFFSDCSPNALADPRTRSILLGANLITQSLTAYQTQPNAFFTLLPLYAILAHEFGHQLQFANGWSNQGDGVVQEELEADMWAGFYVAMRGLSAGYQVDQTVEQFYRLGNFDFFNPNWHGTPYQRANAFVDGIWAAEELRRGVIQNTFSAVRRRLQEMVAVELRYPVDQSPGYVSQSDIRQQCDRYKVPGNYQQCGAQLGWPYDSLPGP